MANSAKKTTHAIEFVGQVNSKMFTTYSQMREYITKAVKSRLAYIVNDNGGVKPIWLSITCEPKDEKTTLGKLSWQYPGEEIKRVYPVSFVDHCGQLGFNPKTLLKK